MEIGTALLISSLIGAGTAVAGGVKQEEARQQADNEAGRQAKKRADMEAAAKARLADEQATAEGNAQRDAQAAAAKARAKTGRAGTILTSPLGASASPAGGKTLLGM